MMTLTVESLACLAAVKRNPEETSRLRIAMDAHRIMGAPENEFCDGVVVHEFDRLETMGLIRREGDTLVLSKRGVKEGAEAAQEILTIAMTLRNILT